MVIVSAILKSLNVCIVEEDNNDVILKPGYNRLLKMVYFILSFSVYILLIYSVNSFEESKIGVIYLNVIICVALFFNINSLFMFLFNSIKIDNNEIIISAYKKYKRTRLTVKRNDVIEISTNFSEGMKSSLKLLIVSNKTIEVHIFGSKPPYLKGHVIEFELFLQKLIANVTQNNKNRIG